MLSFGQVSVGFALCFIIGSLHTSTDLKHLTIRTGDSPWVTKSRSLARVLLIQHLANLNVAVYTFKNITDHGWARYKAAHKASRFRSIHRAILLTYVLAYVRHA
jgi:hypothetical protein